MMQIFETPAIVDGDHKSPFVHDLEGQERTDAKSLVLYELRPPATDAHCCHPCPHIVESPDLKGPLLHSADRGDQCTLFFARPTCFGGEGLRYLLQLATPYRPSERTQGNA